MVLRNYLSFRVLTVSLVSLAFIDCSGSGAPKVGNVGGGNGPGGCVGAKCDDSGKLTPAMGYNASGYMAFTVIPIKELDRVLDIAFNLEKSERLIKNCQSLQTTKISATVDQILLSTTPEPCRSGWRAREVIEITYADENRQDNKKIVKIEKKDRGPGIEFKEKDARREVRISLRDFTLLFELTKDQIYKFQYNGELRMEVTPAKTSAENTMTSDLADSRIILHFAELDAAGTVNLAPNPSFPKGAWQMASASLDYSREVANRSALDTKVTVQPADASHLSPLMCGLPLGEYQMKQNVSINNSKPTEYTPSLVIDDKGTISVKNANVPQFLTSRCQTSGFKDLEATVRSAGEMVMRVPGTSSPVTAGSQRSLNESSNLSSDNGHSSSTMDRNSL